jgi:hypothetical protein
VGKRLADPDQRIEEIPVIPQGGQWQLVTGNENFGAFV